MDDLITTAKINLHSFRLKELKELLGRFGLPKQGRKQLLLQKLEVLLEPRSNSGYSSPPGQVGGIAPAAVAEAVNEVFRLMSGTPNGDCEADAGQMPWNGRDNGGAGNHRNDSHFSDYGREESDDYSRRHPDNSHSYHNNSHPNHQHSQHSNHTRLGRDNATGTSPLTSPLTSPPRNYGGGNPVEVGEVSPSNVPLRVRFPNPNLRSRPQDSRHLADSHQVSRQTGSTSGSRSRRPAQPPSGRRDSRERHQAFRQLQLEGATIRCVCGRNTRVGHEELVQCRGKDCGVWQHKGCVLLAPDKEKGKEEQLCRAPSRDEFYCELCRMARGDPYSLPVSHPLLPQLLQKYQEGLDPVRQSLQVQFNLSNDDLELLRKPLHVLQVWSVLINDRTRNRMHWPAHSDLQVNGRGVRVANRPGQQLLGANGRDEGPPIGDMVQPTNNFVYFRCQDARPFCMGVRIIRARSFEEVMSLVPPLDVGETLEDALKRVERCVGAGQPIAKTGDKDGGGESDEESDDLVVMEEAVTLPFCDPMSGCRITQAGRFRECEHLGCFDLPTLVQMNKRARKWQCPVCMKLCSLETLVVDAFFQRVCQQMTDVDDEAKDVELKPGGLWRPKGPNSRPGFVQEYPWRDIKKNFTSALKLLSHNGREVDGDEVSSAQAKGSAKLFGAGISQAQPPMVAPKAEPWAGAEGLQGAQGNTHESLRNGVDAAAQKRRRLGARGAAGGVTWTQGNGTLNEATDCSATTASGSRTELEEGEATAWTLCPLASEAWMWEGGGAGGTAGAQGGDGVSGGVRSTGGSSGGGLVGQGRVDAPIVLSDSEDDDIQETVPSSSAQGLGLGGSRGGTGNSGPSASLSGDYPQVSLHSSPQAPHQPSPLASPPQARSTGASPSGGVPSSNQTSSRPGYGRAVPTRAGSGGAKTHGPRVMRFFKRFPPEAQAPGPPGDGGAETGGLTLNVFCDRGPQHQGSSEQEIPGEGEERLGLSTAAPQMQQNAREQDWARGAEQAGELRLELGNSRREPGRDLNLSTLDFPLGSPHGTLDGAHAGLSQRGFQEAPSRFGVHNAGNGGENHFHPCGAHRSTSGTPEPRWNPASCPQGAGERISPGASRGQRPDTGLALSPPQPLPLHQGNPMGVPTRDPSPYNPEVDGFHQGQGAPDQVHSGGVEWAIPFPLATDGEAESAGRSMQGTGMVHLDWGREQQGAALEPNQQAQDLTWGHGRTDAPAQAAHGADYTRHPTPCWDDQGTPPLVLEDPLPQGFHQQGQGAMYSQLPQQTNSVYGMPEAGSHFAHGEPLPPRQYHWEAQAQSRQGYGVAVQQWNVAQGEMQGNHGGQAAYSGVESPWQGPDQGTAGYVYPGEDLVGHSWGHLEWANAHKSSAPAQ